MPIQLPNDVENKGYKQTKPFQWEQVFHSEAYDFTGTEKEFLEKGLAYQYVELDPYRHLVSISHSTT